MLETAIQFIGPSLINSYKFPIHFQGPAARMVGAIDFQTMPIINSSGDIKDHGVVEEVGAGEAKAVVAVWIMLSWKDFGKELKKGGIPNYHRELSPTTNNYSPQTISSYV